MVCLLYKQAFLLRLILVTLLLLPAAPAVTWASNTGLANHSFPLFPDTVVVQERACNPAGSIGALLWGVHV